VLRAPAAGLSARADDVDPVAAEVVSLAADLLATQRASPGCVGLAAPQVGVPWRLFSLDVTGHPRARAAHGALVLANPVVDAASRWEKGREGCLSVPDLTGDVKRATRLTVTGVVPGTGAVLSLETDAFEARAVQHELDHLDGLLFLDRVAGAHALHARRVYL
jgi:peptide deformylase